MTEVAQAGWYYVHQGNRIGPVSRQELERLIAEGQITADTQLGSGAEDWRPARKEPSLSHLFPSAAAAQGEPGDLNRLAWAIVAVPLAGAVLERTIGIGGLWFYALAYIALCVWDERRLKAAGRPAPSCWWSLLVPVYLWKRAGALTQGKSYFWGWVAAFALALLVSAGGHQAALEQAAQPVVTQMLKENFTQQMGAQLLGGNIFAAGADPEKEAPKCKAVKIDQKVSAGFYYATAFLDSGKTIKISIEEKGDEILVKAMLDQ